MVVGEHIEDKQNEILKKKIEYNVSKKQIQVLKFIASIHLVTRDHTRHNVNPLYHFAFGSHQSR